MRGARMGWQLAGGVSARNPGRSGYSFFGAFISQLLLPVARLCKRRIEDRVLLLLSLSVLIN